MWAGFPWTVTQGRGSHSPSNTDLRSRDSVSYLAPHNPEIASTTRRTCSWGRGAPNHPLKGERPWRG